MSKRRVLLTGGCGGLGLHVAQAFLVRGDDLTVPIANAGRRQRLVDALGEDMARVETPIADLTDETAVRALFEGRTPPHALVHLVGGFAMGDLDTASLTTLREQLDLNVVTTFLMLRYGLAAMKAAGHGRIVTVASKAALQPAPGLGIYAAAKAAVLALTQAAAEETKGSDVTANAVLPTVIDTPANRAAMGDAEGDTWVRPERLAETIVFLCSDAAGDLRGSPVRVFGSV